MVDMKVAAYEKEASFRPNGVGELRIRKWFDRHDRICFKQDRSLSSFTNHRENWAVHFAAIGGVFVRALTVSFRFK
jgi:hypothetical protein